MSKKTEYIECPKCGTKLIRGSAFCNVCGTAVEGDTIPCKHCGNLIPVRSIFCMYCGSQLHRSKNKQEKKDVRIPEPMLLSSGNYHVQLRINGKSIPITKPTYEECKAEAMAIKVGILEAAKAPKKIILEDVIQTYIDANTGVLSPSTIRSYTATKNSRFKDVMKCDVNSIDWQTVISREATKVKPKTLLNAWRLIGVALKYSKIPVPEVNLPKLVQKEREWLDYEQIQIFLKAIKGKSCETACLLALHSLRISEILALNQGSIKDGYIYVRGAVVPDKENNYVFKETNKNATSTRDVPVMIPRLLEIWPKEGEELKLQALSPMRRMIERICRDNDLPIISIHGLRHSFASLAYHLKWSVRTTCRVGGWSTPDCVQKIYTHLSKLDENSDIDKMKQFYYQQTLEPKL